MEKLRESVQLLITMDPALAASFYQGFANSARLAEVLRPLVAARLKREVSVSAIAMTLSRIRAASKRVKRVHHEGFVVDSMTIYSNLSVFTFYRSREVTRLLARISQTVHAKDGYMTVTEGIGEVTTIIDNGFLELFEEKFLKSARYRNHRIAALVMKFSERYLPAYGFLAQVLQQVAYQGISVIELASTATEFILYLDQRNVRLAFDTIFYRFTKRGRGALC